MVRRKLTHRLASGGDRPELPSCGPHPFVLPSQRCYSNHAHDTNSPDNSADCKFGAATQTMKTHQIYTPLEILKCLSEAEILNDILLFEEFLDGHAVKNITQYHSFIFNRGFDDFVICENGMMGMNTTRSERTHVHKTSLDVDGYEGVMADVRNHAGMKSMAKKALDDLEKDFRQYEEEMNMKNYTSSIDFVARYIADHREGTGRNANAEWDNFDNGRIDGIPSEEHRTTGGSEEHSDAEEANLWSDSEEHEDEDDKSATSRRSNGRRQSGNDDYGEVVVEVVPEAVHRRVERRIARLPNVVV